MNTPQQTPDPYGMVPRGLITPTQGGSATPLYNPNSVRPHPSSAFLPPAAPSRNMLNTNQGSHLFPRPVFPSSSAHTPNHLQHSISSIKSQYGTGLSSVIDVVNGGPSSVLSRQQSIDNTPTPGANPAGMMMPRTPLSLPRYYEEHQPMSSGAVPGTICNVPQPQLQNIVCTVNLCCKLDLKRIALQSRNAEYNPKRFAAVIMRIRDPRTTALIFSSGKMVCTGAKSEDSARQAARKYARIIQKLSFNAQFRDFKIQNMVASCDVGFHLRLEGLVIQHQKFSTYEPELFPGLIYRMTKPKIVLLLFVSGKVVLTGAKMREEIYQAFEYIYPVLKNFSKS